MLFALCLPFLFLVYCAGKVTFLYCLMKLPGYEKVCLFFLVPRIRDIPTPRVSYSVNPVFNVEGKHYPLIT